ncbi:methionyl-tRNA synthetase, putative [Babesia ovis]|uniref:Methionyl-tRNA synthetase, putative n=1 Tax=Babesia ovis TaxID=5869 RepID=A0A9W5TDB3_BABOV|nr:methionyl-tRNA synthetase, putative [Babesia ovis]
MADIADRVVFERHKCSRQAKESIRSLGSKGVSDIFSMLAGSNSQAVNNLDNIWTVSVISYSCAASGISIPTEVLLGYINAVYKQMSQLLQGGGSTITTLDNTEETVLHRLSETFGLLLLSAAELGLFNNLKQITNELLHQPLLDKFLHHSSGSCINAVAFVDANDSMYSSMNDTALVNAILESLSNKEMSLTTRDLFYAKLWVTRVGTMAPQNVIHSFVQNVVMLDHVSELVGAATDAETSVFTKLREQHRDVDMDFLTLEPFVFPLVSSMSKELYEPDHAECYFDQDARTWKREYLNWRKMTADSNGWKVVDIIL